MKRRKEKHFAKKFPDLLPTHLEPFFFRLEWITHTLALMQTLLMQGDGCTALRISEGETDDPDPADREGWTAYTRMI